MGPTISAIPPLVQPRPPAAGQGEKITFYYVVQDRKASAPGDEEVREFINKKFNVDYKRIDIAQDAIGQKLPLMVATGEQIDFFSAATFGTGPTGLPILVDKGLVQPVDEYLAKYGKNLMKEIPEFAWKYVTYNGKKMSVPDMGFKSKRILFVRRDWMDNLGIKNPQTYFDLCFLSAFVPTGNSWYLDKDGKFVPWFFHPGYKDYMAKFSQWYKDQLIHPDIIILKREELKSVVVQGMVGVFPEWYSLSNQDEMTAANPSPTSTTSSRIGRSRARPSTRSSTRSTNDGFLKARSLRPAHTGRAEGPLKR